jgi:hypothetical protein
VLGQALLALKRYDEGARGDAGRAGARSRVARRPGVGRGAAAQSDGHGAAECWAGCAARAADAHVAEPRRGRAAGSRSPRAIRAPRSATRRIWRRSPPTRHQELPGAGRRARREATVRTAGASSPGRPRWPRPARASDRAPARRPAARCLRRRPYSRSAIVGHRRGRPRAQRRGARGGDDLGARSARPSPASAGHRAAARRRLGRPPDEFDDPTRRDRVLEEGAASSRSRPPDRRLRSAPRRKSRRAPCSKKRSPRWSSATTR